MQQQLRHHRGLCQHVNPRRLEFILSPRSRSWLFVEARALAASEQKGRDHGPTVWSFDRRSMVAPLLFAGHGDRLTKAGAVTEHFGDRASTLTTARSPKQACHFFMQKMACHVL